MKWAGGKRWLASAVVDRLPSTYGTYIEPFVGSAAVFFAVAPKRAVLSDVNERLIETYQQVRDNPYLVRRYLGDYHERHSSEFYYRERGRARRGAAARAAQFIYFNRTCWNALYRVNRKGEFNVPIGTKTNVHFGAGDIVDQSRALRAAHVVRTDFEETIDRAKRGDFIFADPPYTVKHNLNGFVKYNEVLFGWEDQIRLRKALGRAVKRGATVMITNADHESIRSLYEGFGEHRALSRSSVIAGSSSARGRYTELVIVA